jgi:uncharacterized protein DUF551
MRLAKILANLMPGNSREPSFVRSEEGEMSGDDFDYISPGPTVVRTLHCYEWQPIETAPKDGRDLLLANIGIVRLAFWDEARGGQWSIWPGRDQFFKPTHWMPLPEPPK